MSELLVESSYDHLLREYLNELFGKAHPQALWQVTGRVSNLFEHVVAVKDEVDLAMQLLDEGIPFSVPYLSNGTVDMRGDVDHYKPLVPLPWVVGYWVERGMISDEKAGWEHLLSLGWVPEEGIFRPV
jgi:hypothetical protein